MSEAGLVEMVAGGLDTCKVTVVVCVSVVDPETAVNVSVPVYTPEGSPVGLVSTLSANGLVPA